MSRDAILLDAERPAVGTVCALLRTKMMHVLGVIERDAWTSSSTAQYWCLRSMQDFGPDGELACPEDCQSCRGCYSDEP